jgi:signal transduction histidine kinase
MPLKDVVATHELSRRPSRLPDFEAENRTLLSLTSSYTDEPAQMLRRVASAALDLCRADSAGIAALDRDDDARVRSAAVAGRLATIVRGEVSRRGSPIGTTLDADRPLLFMQPQRHFRGLRPLGVPIAEALAAPFHIGGRPAGVIWIAAHSANRHFDIEDERLLVNLSRLAAAGCRLERASRRRRASTSEARLEGELWAVGRLDALSTRLLTSPSRTSALEEILDAAIDLQSADMGTLQVFNDERQALELVAHRGFGSEFLDHFRFVGPNDGSACGRALRTRATVVVEDVARDAAFSDHLDVATNAGFQAVLSTPLRSPGGAVLGIISTHFRRVHKPSDHEVRMLELYAYHAVGLLEAMRAQEALRDAVRRKDDFLAMLGHELRNPLAPMRTALEVMRMRGPASREQEVLERQVHHLSRMVEDLLDVSRVTLGKIELRRRPMELAEAVRSGLDQAAPLIERRRHHVDVDVPAGLGVSADADRLAQVVANLLTNAAKFSEAGSRIAMRGRRAAGRVRLEVQDDGIGIPSELLPTLFDAFVQRPQSIERSYGGLGLGLAIVRSLVALHDGTIHAESAGAGHGSMFVLELPEVELTAGDAAPPSEPAPPVHVRGTRVLVVDDNEDAADVLRVALSTLGYDVEVAHDGPSAIEVARGFQPELALLDIGLPVMDGYDLAPRLRKVSHAPLRLVAVTGYGQRSDYEQSRNAGFEEHLVKPVDLGRLQAVIEARPPAPA